MCHSIKLGALCNFGKNAANVVFIIVNSLINKTFNYDILIAINNFYSKFKERAIIGTIGKSIEFYIDVNKCKKCSMCLRHCPAGEISGIIRLEPFKIDKDKCIKCWTCFSICKFGVVRKK